MASSDQKRPLKGILKQPKPVSSQDQDSSLDDVRRVAVAHATLIQQQKAVEAEILDCIIHLLEFPLVREPSFSSTNPAASDATQFKALVRLFQPTDYDDLIEERNLVGLCGYSLCARPRKKFPGSGTWKLVNQGRIDFNIVAKKDLEKWCSDDCARRALYVKVQLNETAAWERVGIPDIQIDLLGEDEQPASAGADLSAELSNLKLEEARKVAEATSALAIERGEPKRQGVKDLANLAIREKSVLTAPVAPSLEAGDDKGEIHLLMEGHKTR